MRSIMKNIQIIIADYIYTPSGYIANKSIAFDEQILAIDDAYKLTQKYPQAEIIRTMPHSIIYPGFINTHVHLEFSSNKTTLEYGDFMTWLHSVIESRTELIESCDDEQMMAACDEMLRSGITTFGAISSYGTELEVCKKTPQRVVFFNELIGSDPSTVDTLYADFQERLANSKATKESESITPAIAIHSPYSVHPIVIKKAVALAKEKGYPLSTHFLESKAERDWLESSQGGFAKFFKQFFGSSRAVTGIDEFMSQFDGYPSHFVHCTQTTKAEKDYLAKQGHSIAHCPRSNRLLGCGRLRIEDIESTLSIATDGLSSNHSLNIWDELRAALMLHQQAPLLQLSDRLIKSITSDAAKAINSKAGALKAGSPADIAIVTLSSKCNSTAELSLHTILHTQSVSMVFIGGVKRI